MKTKSQRGLDRCSTNYEIRGASALLSITEMRKLVNTHNERKSVTMFYVVGMKSYGVKLLKGLKINYEL